MHELALGAQSALNGVAESLLAAVSTLSGVGVTILAREQGELVRRTLNQGHDDESPSRVRASNSGVATLWNAHTIIFAAMEYGGGLACVDIHKRIGLIMPTLGAPITHIVTLPTHAGRQQEIGDLLVCHADGSLVVVQASALFSAMSETSPMEKGDWHIIKGKVVPFVKLHPVGLRGLYELCVLSPPRSPLFEPTWSEADRRFGGFTLLTAARSPAAALYHVNLDDASKSLGELAVAAAARLGSAVRGIAKDVQSALPGPVSSGLLRFGGSMLSAAGSLLGTGRGSGGPPPTDEEAASARLAALRSANGHSVSVDIDFSDEGRRFVTLLPDPVAHRMVLASDAAGRVLLIDGTDLTILRTWKGYRDCQLGWGSFQQPGRPPRLCCLLLSPRRRQIEAWPAGPAGDRVAALRLQHAEMCRLVQVKCSHLGPGAATARCLLVGPADAGIAATGSLSPVTSDGATDDGCGSSQTTVAELHLRFRSP